MLFEPKRKDVWTNTEVVVIKTSWPSTSSDYELPDDKTAKQQVAKWWDCSPLTTHNASTYSFTISFYDCDFIHTHTRQFTLSLINFNVKCFIFVPNYPLLKIPCS